MRRQSKVDMSNDNMPGPADCARPAALRDTRIKAVAWLCDRVAADGTPVASEIGNSWWRAPWALCVGGAPDVAAAMLGWIERNALTDQGDLRDGPFGGGQPGSSVYLLSPIAIAAALLARYDLAEAVMDRLETYQDPVTGGAYNSADFRQEPLQDLLKTAQLGISALVTGRTAAADGVCSWLKQLYAKQPELPTKLYTGLRNGELVTTFGAKEAFVRVVDFSAPKQAYFNPGIAAAFLAGYSQKTGDVDALTLGERYLALNESGTTDQFDDRSSVQICKFGWGVAAMHTASPTLNRLHWLNKMADWFVSRQESDGSWAPSSFMTPRPGMLDYFWKTAEHLMEVSYIESALLQARHRMPQRNVVQR
jgi:hypothetical protein